MINVIKINRIVDLKWGQNTVRCIWNLAHKWDATKLCFSSWLSICYKNKQTRKDGLNNVIFIITTVFRLENNWVNENSNSVSGWIFATFSEQITSCVCLPACIDFEKQFHVKLNFGKIIKRLKKWWTLSHVDFNAPCRAFTSILVSSNTSLVSKAQL